MSYPYPCSTDTSASPTSAETRRRKPVAVSRQNVRGARVRRIEPPSGEATAGAMPGADVLVGSVVVVINHPLTQARRMRGSAVTGS